MAEQALLLDHAREAILVRDRHQRITYWNRGAEILYGWTAQEAVVAVAEGEHVHVTKAGLSAFLRSGKCQITHRFSRKERPSNERRADAVEGSGKERIVGGERLLARVPGTRGKCGIYVDNPEPSIDVFPKDDDVMEVLHGRLKEAKLGPGGILGGEIEKPSTKTNNFAIFCAVGGTRRANENAPSREGRQPDLAIKRDPFPPNAPDRS